jgi:1,4-alpha-glucan branching enzyme
VGERDVVLVVANFTPTVREPFRVGVPFAGPWREILNSDAEVYGGSGVVNDGGGPVAGEPGFHGRPFAVELRLPPLACCFLVPDDPSADG